MRAKRSKKYRKLMHQYETAFGFHEPYQVLVDSNFLRSIYAFKIDLMPALERTLQGQVKPLLSKCSLAAIMETAPKTSPNSSYQKRPPQLPAPTVLPLRHCSHNEDSTPIDEVSCLLSLLSPNAELKKNKEHYILATADPEPVEENPPRSRAGQKRKVSEFAPERPVRSSNRLRQGARAIPGVPIIYVKRSVVILEPMSGSSEDVRDGLERGKLKTGVADSDVVTGKRKREDDGGSAQTHERGLKKAKGPNPLSMRKPKKRSGPDGPGSSAAKKKQHRTDGSTPQHDHEGPSGQGEGAAQTKAKRRRRHKGTRADGGNEPESGSGATEAVVAAGAADGAE